MSSTAMAWVTDIKGYRHRDHKFLLVMVADDAEPTHGLATTSIEDLSVLCLMDAARVLECLDELEADGFLAILRRTEAGHPTLIRLNLSETTFPQCVLHPGP